MHDESKPHPAPTLSPSESRDNKDAGGHGGARPTRRTFLTQLGLAGITVTASPLLSSTQTSPAPAQAPAQAPASTPGTVPVELNINGKQYRLTLDPRTTVLDALRENLNLFGTKKGCDHGQCGACTVHINGRRVNSCLTFAMMHQADQITTIEGLARNGQLHPVQAAFVEFDGFQCGYCTPARLCRERLCSTNQWGKDNESVHEMMSGNLCRCGAYDNIVDAVQSVRRKT